MPHEAGIVPDSKPKHPERGHDDFILLVVISFLPYSVHRPRRVKLRHLRRQRFAFCRHQFVDRLPLTTNVNIRIAYFCCCVCVCVLDQ